MKYEQILFKILFILTILIAECYASQIVTVRGIARDSINNLIAISVNDTIRKFRDKAFENKDWKGYDALVNDKNFFTIPDSAGNYAITAKVTDTLYFSKRKHATQKYKVADIIRDNIQVFLKRAPCIPNKECDQKTPSKLYIFVGKKINVTSVDTSQYCGDMMDSEYKAEYKIEQEFSEHYPSSTIIFTAYDHNSMYEFDFRNYDHVLIFVGEYCGDLIHLKYQFFPLYKTADGRWATPVKPKAEQIYQLDQYTPSKIDFDQSVNFDLPYNLTEEQIAQVRTYKFPEKYYDIKDHKAIPIMGRYAEDLVKIWKEMDEKNKE